MQEMTKEQPSLTGRHDSELYNCLGFLKYVLTDPFCLYVMTEKKITKKSYCGEKLFKQDTKEGIKQKD